MKLMVLASLCIAMLVVPAVQAAPSTRVAVIRYANDGATILDQKSYTYQQLEQEFPVHGDGSTHYYFQGPTFEDADPYNPAENINVQSRDFGAVKGTDVKDLCEAVGGMSPGETVRMKATDNFYRDFSYEAVYGTDPRKGPMVLAWYNGEESQGGYELQGVGYPDTGYYLGMRLFFFADTSTNPWHCHVFGHWDMHETLPESDWYNFSGIWPSSGGLSMKYVDRILIYSDDSPLTVVPLEGYSAPPTDPDGDGLYEDLNANGRKDFNDVVLFFERMEWIAVHEPLGCFDFNGNGRIDFNDIVLLFGEL